MKRPPKRLIGNIKKIEDENEPFIKTRNKFGYPELYCWYEDDVQIEFLGEKWSAWAAAYNRSLQRVLRAAGYGKSYYRKLRALAFEALDIPKRK